MFALKLSRMRQVVVFDFDGTLTRRDTLFLFARFAKGSKALMLALLHELPRMLLAKAGIYPRDKAKERLLARLYRGMNIADFRECGRRFAAEIDRITRKGILEILLQHARNGDTTYIISASVVDWIRPWAMQNGVSAVSATLLETDTLNNITGRYDGANCNNGEKVRRLMELVPDRKSYMLTVYGDSAGDVPLMRFADKAYIVTGRGIRSYKD